MLSLFYSTPNVTQAAKLLLDVLNVKISETTIKKEIEEHPDYPSLLCISDLLKAYHVENLTIKVKHDKFNDLPTPFVTQITVKKDISYFFTVVKEINKDTIHFFDPEKNKWDITSHEDFSKRCSGIVLLTEVGEGDVAGEKGYEKKIKEEKRKRAGQYITAFCIPAIVLVTGIFSFSQNGISALLPLAFFMLTLVGSITAVLLLWYEIDQHNPVLQQICSAGKKVNCGAILQSKASKIAGISWSSIGFSYFTGVLLLLLFSGVTNHQALFVSAWVNVLALPYVCFSLYYQWRIAKQWCVLCLVVQGLLVLQLITALTGGWHTFLPLGIITPNLIIHAITAFVIPFVAATILLPALRKAKESKRHYTELQKLKHNSQIFETLLQKQKKVVGSPQGLGITLGNPNASYKLIKVCSPYCGPCAKAHTPMEELLHNNSDVQVQVLFTATNDEEDTRTPPVKHLLAIAKNNSEEVIKHALDDWYLAENKDYEAFAAKYPINGELKLQDANVEAMREWCDKVKIEFTPTFFVAIADSESEDRTTFYQLPDVYSVSDLKYFFAV